MKRYCSKGKHSVPTIEFVSSTPNRFFRTCKRCREKGVEQRRGKVNRPVLENGNRRCTSCLDELPEDEFDNATTKKCKACRNKNLKQSRRYSVKHRADVERMKVEKGGKCIDCGLSDTEVLEFDHRNPTDKKSCVPILYGRTLIEEAEKCDLRCIKCHRLKTLHNYEENCNSYVTARRLRIELVNDEKRKRGCMNCGQKVTADWPVFAFDMDHVDRSSKVTTICILVKTGAPLSDLITELAKCQVLCCHCHRKHTNIQMRADGDAKRRRTEVF